MRRSGFPKCPHHRRNVEKGVGNGPPRVARLFTRPKSPLKMDHQPSEVRFKTKTADTVGPFTGIFCHYCLRPVSEGSNFKWMAVGKFGYVTCTAKFKGPAKGSWSPSASGHHTVPDYVSTLWFVAAGPRASPCESRIYDPHRLDPHPHIRSLICTQFFIPLHSHPL